MEWALLEYLSDDERRRLRAAATRRRFAKGEVVFHEGDPGDTLHLLEKGHVAIRVRTPLGDVATLRVLGPGEFFGEFAVISPRPRNATVVAIDPVATLTLQRSQIDALRREHPRLNDFLLETAVTELRRLSTQLVEALYLPVSKRVLRRLTEVAALYGEPPVSVPISQEDLAGLAGATRQSTNKALQQAAADGAIALHRGAIEVIDPQALTRRAR